MDHSAVMGSSFAFWFLGRRRGLAIKLKAVVFLVRGVRGKRKRGKAFFVAERNKNLASGGVIWVEIWAMGTWRAMERSSEKRRAQV